MLSFEDLYLLYAKLEEEHGLSRHAMAVYDRATKAVLPEQKCVVCLHAFNCGLCFKLAVRKFYDAAKDKFQ